MPGLSLARLLSEQRGVRNKQCLPRLTERQIAAWTAAHHDSPLWLFALRKMRAFRGAKGDNMRPDH